MQRRRLLLHRNMHPTEAHRHRTKRHLGQPAITDFFPVDENSDSHPHNDTRPPHHPTLAPHVPGAVQADLLQVGMRVRKSVPEGYKTHANKMIALSSVQTTMTSTMTLTPPPAAPANVVHQRELLPFCGLHNMGGFAEQPTTNIHLYTGEPEREARDMWPLPAETFTQPFHSCSQDSGYGSIRANANPSKRSWHDEDHLRLNLSPSSFAFGKQANVEIEEVPVSPLSEIPADMMPAVRQIKQPKSRRRDGELAGGNGSLRVAVGSGSDFDEADFLGSGEVVMGGV